MKKAYFGAIAIASSLLFADAFPPVQSVQEVQNELNFLTSPSDQIGFTYQGSVGDLSGLTLPLSYYSTADYWGKYVGGLPGNDLHVTDVYNPGDYTLTPTPDSPGKDLQVERVNVYNGTDIYDAACWQIALGVCGKAGMKGDSGQDLFDLAQNEDELLLVGYDGNAPQPQPGANRATTRSDGTFGYNGENITAPANAYFFRMVTRSWLSTDPFMGTSYMQYIKAENLPPNPQYEAGKITWQDWKPITGENAWAFFIGALQTAYLKQEAGNQKYVPFSSNAVQNALGTLYALRCMQSELGGIYYACKGSLGNQGEQPVNPYEVSVENNASSLAGLMIFQQILQDELHFETDLTSEQKQKVQTALSEIKAMLHGGQTPQGKQTKGLLSFFKNNAWDSNAGIFYQGGDANNPKLASDWVPTTEPKAVDVNTWGASVLGQPQLDSWYGFGTSYKIWQNVKSWGGFFGPDKTIWGVGYSDKDGNGSGGSYEKGIISAEWTAGAINMLRCLITQYKEAATSSKYTPAEQQQASQYVQELQKDHDSMFKNIMTLRSDLYPKANAYSANRPADYGTLIPIHGDRLAFVYASKRYMIPFGWFANPIPSTTSTSWVVMLHFNFNPFKVGGNYEAYSFDEDRFEVFIGLQPDSFQNELSSFAREVCHHFHDGFQWEDITRVILDSRKFLKENYDLTPEETRSGVKQILDLVIDYTDTPYLPDAFTDPLFKSMMHPFVNLMVPLSEQSHSNYPPQSGTPADEKITEYGNALAKNYENGFCWNDLAEVVDESMAIARSFADADLDAQAGISYRLVEYVIDETNTAYLPDFFVDWIFKRVAYSMVHHLINQ